MGRIKIEFKVLVISEKGQRQKWMREKREVSGCLVFEFLTGELDTQMFILLFSRYFCKTELFHK